MDEIRSIARSYFDGDMNPAHDWHHVQRVESLAETLLETYGGADERVVHHAVWLHDIGRAREDRGEIDDHAEWGAEKAEQLLESRGEDGDHVDAVCHAIRVHRYSNDLQPETREAEILCDADNLDALGAVGIARCFSYGGEREETIHDPDISLDEDDTAVGRTQYNHFHKKILNLPDRMYTEAGRVLAEERGAFVERFLDRFDREVAGQA